MKNAANWWLPSRRMLVILCLLLGGIGVAHAAEVQKGYYDDPGIYPNRAYINNHYAERIDPFNGGVQQQYVDLFLPGNGKFDLKLIRSYLLRMSGVR